MPGVRPGTVFVTMSAVVATAVASIVLITAQTTPPPIYKPAQRLCVLCDFGTKLDDPSLPQFMGLLADGGDGYIYGTSSSGGVSAPGLTANQGTIFRFSPTTGALEVLYRFDFTDHGSNPMGGLVRDLHQPVFYGTTYQGGRYHFPVNGKDAAKLGAGVIFRFKYGDAAPTVIQAFRNGDTTGLPLHRRELPVPHLYYTPQDRLNAAAGYPMSAPVQGSDGKFYGVASKGLNYDLGILYTFDPGSGAYKALCIGGQMFGEDEEPSDQQLRDRCMFVGERGGVPNSLTANPNKPELYGTTLGIVPGAPNGTVFKATLDGRVTTLKNFTNLNDGRQPFGVILASDGRLYGTTRYGGPNGLGNPGAGVVYRISPIPGEFLPGLGFQVLHELNGTTEGAGSVSELVEIKLRVFDPVTSLNVDRTFLYGAASIAGEGQRGTIFRVEIGDTVTPKNYEVAYTFPSVWSAAGSKPLSTMTKYEDPTTKRPALVGTTNGGGIANYGALFRLNGLDLPPVRYSRYPPSFTPTPGRDKQRIILTKPIPIAGQTDMIVTVRTDMDAGQFMDDGVPIPLAKGQGADGIMVVASNCRNPHIIQFISRSKFNVVSKEYIPGIYYLKDGVSYQFSTDDNEAYWHWNVDAANGPPNPYYDENWGAVHILQPNVVTMLDSPTFGLGVNYDDSKPERWRAVFDDYVICNCKAVARVRWTREATPTFDPVTQKATHAAIDYKDVSINPASPTAMDWINTQLQMAPPDQLGRRYPPLP